MESLLKYLRGGAVAGNQRAPVAATTIAASVCGEDGGGGGGGGDVDDDASFFDLEFAVPGEESAAEEERVEFNFADVASGAEVVAVDDAGWESKKDDSSAESEAEVAAPPPASVPLRPAATKFRVLMLKLRKPNNKVDVPADGAAAAKTSNRFLIKFRVDDNSSRTSEAAAQQQQQSQEDITAEERRFAKEVVLKYLNKMKPLYVKVSRLRFPGAASSEGEETETDAEPDPSSPAPSPSAAAAAPQPMVVACGVRAPRASVPAGLKQACKRLGKSRSASSAVAAAPPATTATPPVPQRRDDSLLQLQDGIQSAIAHCKRSFNASKGCESPLLRSMTMTVGGDATRDGGQ